MFDYDAQDADELHFREGDVIEVIEQSKTLSASSALQSAVLDAGQLGQLSLASPDSLMRVPAFIGC